MFLAIKEMRYAKLRYGLIIGIMVLIAYVVMMLSGLATGLAQEFSQAIEDWHVSHVVLSEDANKTLAASHLSQSDIDKIEAKQTAQLGVYSGAITKGKQKININVFGTDHDAFILPKIVKGKMYQDVNEIIISQNLADKGYKIGDKVKIGNGDQKLKVVGIVPVTYYVATPVIYTSLETWQELKATNLNMSGKAVQQPVNLVAIKDKKVKITQPKKNKLQKLTAQQFIEAIPGYTEQKLTLDAMIYFLFIVVAAIVGIFMYVITIQKTAIFGVMKAQGISSGFIARSILAQSFLVGVIGVILAVVLAYLTSLVLPAAMPFAIEGTQWLIYSVILVIVAMLGGLFSVRAVNKVDPIRAIGG